MQRSHPKNILLCGGSGFIGQKLAEHLSAKGHNVFFFTHQKKLSNNSKYKYYYWNPKTAYLNPDILKSAQVIINLSGSKFLNKRWSRKIKMEAFESRIITTRFLYSKIKEMNHSPEIFINASAIGFYDNNNQIDLMTEESPNGNDFLSYLTWNWEKEAINIAELGIRTVIFRMGLVMSNDNGILPLLIRQFNLYLGSVWGKGTQNINWIHIKDLCSMFSLAIENKDWDGIYNAVSPMPISNHDLAHVLKKILNKPVISFKIPEAIIEFLFGEMSTLILNGAKVCSKKALSHGFKFKYLNIEHCIKSLID